MDIPIEETEIVLVLVAAAAPWPRLSCITFTRVFVCVVLYALLLCLVNLTQTLHERVYSIEGRHMVRNFYTYVQ